MPDTGLRDIGRRPLVDPTLLAAVTRDAIPDAVGELERAKAVLLTRLVTPERTLAREPDAYLTAAQVAQRLNVSRKLVYAMREELGGRKIGAAVRFSERSVRRYLEARRP